MYGRWFWSIVCVLLTVPASVHASPAYGPLLQRTYELPCEPTCLVCHTQPQGGFASANTKLGITLRRMFDLECCDVAALETVLTRLEQGRVDSDGDGASDAQELRAMTDPNVPDAVTAPTELACQPASKDGGCALARQRSAVSWRGVLLACALLLLRRLRATRSLC